MEAHIPEIVLAVGLAASMIWNVFLLTARDAARRNLKTTEQAYRNVVATCDRLENELGECRDELKIEAEALKLRRKVLDLVGEAVPLAEKMQRVKGRSGANKRHYVYQEMIRRHPDKDKRDIGLAIELAVRKL